MSMNAAVSFLSFTGNKISTQTGIGTVIAIAGVAIYSVIKAKMEEEKRVIYSLLFSILIFSYFHLSAKS